MHLSTPPTYTRSLYSTTQLYTNKSYIHFRSYQVIGPTVQHKFFWYSGSSTSVLLYIRPLIQDVIFFCDGWTTIFQGKPFLTNTQWWAASDALPPQDMTQTSEQSALKKHNQHSTTPPQLTAPLSYVLRKCITHPNFIQVSGAVLSEKNPVHFTAQLNVFQRRSPSPQNVHEADNLCRTPPQHEHGTKRSDNTWSVPHWGYSACISLQH